MYEYVPFNAKKDIALVVDDNVAPFRVTDHEVPDGRPDSLNNTVYTIGKFIFKILEVLFTVNSCCGELIYLCPT